MLREAIFATLLVTVAVGLPLGDDQDQDLNFVLRNITAIWEELQDIRQEINHHMHDGHEELDHDQALQEVETLHHEHHVHHLHHPHEGHNEHHDNDLLKHLTEVHGHMDHHGEGPSAHGHGHSHGHDHGHGHGHGHGHDHEHGHGHGHDHEHGDHEENEQTPHENEDLHDTHGLHSHEDDHEYIHEKKSHKTSSSHHHHHHQKGHSDSNFDDDDDDDDDDSSERSKPGPARRPGLALIPGRGGDNAQPEDPWVYATCALEPNVDMPESHAKGTIVISQRRDKKGPVYFDLHIEDVDVSKFGTIHGFHVHENPVAGGSCGSTGGHFNPAGTDHGAPEDDVRHVGDLGNIEVDENGELHGHIISDRLAAFQGPHNIVGKALVLHAGEDDLGKGGYADSLTTGHAGTRLACCTIHIKAMPYFRFKG